MATKLSRPLRRTTEVIVERRRRLVVSVYALAVKAEVARRKVEQAVARRKAGTR
jgi:hypothetical protein